MAFRELGNQCWGLSLLYVFVDIQMLNDAVRISIGCALFGRGGGFYDCEFNFQVLLVEYGEVAGFALYDWGDGPMRVIPFHGRYNFCGAIMVPGRISL